MRRQAKGELAGSGSLGSGAPNGVRTGGEGIVMGGSVERRSRGRTISGRSIEASVEVPHMGSR